MVENKKCRAQDPSTCSSPNCPEKRSYLSAMRAFVEEAQTSPKFITTTSPIAAKKYNADTTKANHFGFQRKVIDAFTNSDCWRLAHYIRERTGWDIVAIGELRDATAVPADRYWYHMAVRTPMGNILDITGLHLEADFVFSWAMSYAGSTENASLFVANDPDYLAVVDHSSERPVARYGEHILNALPVD